jgi:hypothetical protein
MTYMLHCLPQQFDSCGQLPEAACQERLKSQKNFFPNPIWIPLPSDHSFSDFLVIPVYQGLCHKFEAYPKIVESAYPDIRERVYSLIRKNENDISA